MLFVVGLGNPGSSYAGSRHNVGFDVADCMASRLNVGFEAGRGEFLIAQADYEGQSIGLIKPLTYMNQSGVAILDVRERYGLDLSELLVVCDDFQLPLGRLRLRVSGSDGGHNGLYSVIYHLQSEEFPRLRCGIASDSTPKDKDQMAEYVLKPFTVEERLLVDKMVDRAMNACLSVITDGMTRAMNMYNTEVDAEER